jgi:hypothetical protein
MIELAVVTGWSLEELEALDDVELATFVAVVAERHGGRRRA